MQKTGKAYRQHSILQAWLLVFIWAGGIFAVSSIPSLRSDFPDSWDLILRKIAHMTEYAVLAILLYRAQSIRSRPALAFSVLVFMIATGYAATDEIHQSFVPGRDGSPVDLLIDAAGAFIGTSIFLRAYRKRRSRSRDR